MESGFHANIVRQGRSSAEPTGGAVSGLSGAGLVDHSAESPGLQLSRGVLREESPASRSAWGSAAWELPSHLPGEPVSS